jgi:hypothetical protein
MDYIEPLAKKQILRMPHAMLLGHPNSLDENKFGSPEQETIR